MKYLKHTASSRFALALVLACTGALFATSALAGEKGKIRSRASLVTIKFEQAKVEDQAEHVVMYGEMDGVLFTEPSGGFLDKARYQVVYLSDSSGMVSGGYKTFTTADGAKVFAKFTDTEMAPPVYKGTFELIGGTGKYQGIKGKGTWTYTSVSDSAAWDEMEGEYELP
ncbi:MAG: hypothetical protein NFCOHLIN_01088 [Gammaproteobacteria bacterium]|nr:hypothetical protein [Gammaproteobacteria bacterium]